MTPCRPYLHPHLRHVPRFSALATSVALVMASLGSAAQTAPDANKAHHGPALKTQTPVTLNFVNADIEAVTRAIGVMMDKQFVIDPRVKGTITLYSEQPVTVQEAYLNYLAGLRGLGFTVVEAGGLLKVVPEADAKLQAGTVAVDQSGQRGDLVLTQIFRLNHENANNMVTVLRPLITPNNTINANPGNNSLVITDYADNLKRIAHIIAAMDTPATTDIEVVPLKHAVASDLAALVQKLSDGSSGATPAPGAAAAAGGTSNGVSVLADPRNNSLILRAPNAARLASMRAIVDKLDQPGVDAAGNVHVVYLKNAEASKIAAVLRAAFATTGSGAGAATSAGNATGSAASTTNTFAPTSSTSTNSSGTSSNGMASSVKAVSASPAPSTGGFVQADPASNSLVITAPEPQYRQIRAVIDQLDGRRAQVYVESMIVKVNVTKMGQFGVQWQTLLGTVAAGTNFGTGSGNIVNASAAIAGGATTAQAAVTAGVPGGLNLGAIAKVGHYTTLGALANFLQTETGANVLSTPNLVALDGEEAQIVVGQNVPFVTGSYSTTSTTGTVNPFQTIERQDVGLTLKIRSQIGEGGTIRMTVYQENSSVVAGSTTSSGPTTDKSAIQTSVTVNDGEILVLGGLMQDEYDDADNSVPGLASLPLVGNLFKSVSRTRIKTNLMVFLRPIIVRNSKTLDDLTLDRYEVIRASQKDAQTVPQNQPFIPNLDNPVVDATPQPMPRPGPMDAGAGKPAEQR
ncbi:MAG: type II secretion system secretin GspD [Burkholderiaceae bacterium]|nr:type II secretion system secretin GspD [Burkholderiaceae bacterium]